MTGVRVVVDDGATYHDAVLDGDVVALAGEVVVGARVRVFPLLPEIDGLFEIDAVVVAVAHQDGATRATISPAASPSRGRR